MNPRTFFFALAATAAALAVHPAEARHRTGHSHTAAASHCVYDNDGRVTCRGAGVTHRRASQGRTAQSLSARRHTGGFGLVTIPTAAGIQITVSSSFAGPAANLIAAAVAQGRHFRRINCYSWASTHRRNSNHHAGDACDAYPAIRAALVRAHGLRSGCDFRDCTHFDNARNVGGVAYWNSVRHGRHGPKRHRRVARR